MIGLFINNQDWVDDSSAGSTRKLEEQNSHDRFASSQQQSFSHGRLTLGTLKLVGDIGTFLFLFHDMTLYGPFFQEVSRDSLWIISVRHILVPGRMKRLMKER